MKSSNIPVIDVQSNKNGLKITLSMDYNCQLPFIANLKNIF